jgi:hypothetical protein
MEMMSQEHQSTVQRLTYISRNIFYSFLLIFCLSAVFGIFSQVLEISWTWFEVIGHALLVFSVGLLVISWITPGILILLGKPWLAHAWLRGINPVAIWKTPWEQSSGFQDFLIYFWSILFSGFTLFGIIGFILQSFRK